MKRHRKPTVKLAANPQPCRPIFPDSDTVLSRKALAEISVLPFTRRLDCKRYDACLDVACVKGWPSWTCSLCEAFVPSDRLVRAAADVAVSLAADRAAGRAAAQVINGRKKL